MSVGDERPGTTPAGRTDFAGAALLRRLWPLAVVAGLLALAALAASHSTLRFTRTDPVVDDVPLPDYQAPVLSPTPQPVADADGAAIPDWILVAAMVLGLLLAAVLAGLLIRALIRDLRRRGAQRRARAGRTRRPPAQRTAEEVVAALDAGLVDLSDADADPRRAVIACWVRLEQAAADAGMPRRIGDTPTDLVSRLLRGGAGETGGTPTVVSADVLSDFAHVYREARYATHPVDERTRAQARSALTRLRAELTTGAGG
ncbi:DUF4129 domain-containing protein [Micromonospora sp. NPDC049559]|uniref:DUF4129 domain-containing protein n=1 Tax=Micromonospora sp. NPDC049559 TaxID=3155923 RepID=UPI00343150BA